MPHLNKMYNSRPAQKDDLESLVDLYNEYWEVMTGITKFTLDEFNNIFSTPGFSLEYSSQVVTSPLNEIIASILVLDLGEPPIHPNIYGCVREGSEGKGIGTYLVRWAEARARDAIKRCPEEARVSMYIQTTPSHKQSVHLLEKLNLVPIRYSWYMTKNLDEAQPEPVWPDRIHIQTCQEYYDLEAILHITDEAFEDHWGHVDRSGDEERIKRFKHSVESDEAFDPSLWYLAMDGDEIAGVALCNPRLGADNETGLVNTLGVRRPWRCQGLGLALLNHAFGEFYNRGYKQVGLGVDTQNLSGATRLYEKAGMQATSEIVIYEKELRTGIELSKQ